jgi:hypothetical protein
MKLCGFAEDAEFWKYLNRIAYCILADHGGGILMLTEITWEETENILRISKMKLCVFGNYAKVALILIS